MRDINRIRVFITLLTITFVVVAVNIIGLYARGYRFDQRTFKFVPKGILVIKSNPDGAQVFINGELETATNATIPLTPGTYDFSIRKDGYFSWEKRLTIEKEIVTQADAHLFRVAPSLSPITFSGVASTIPSDDFTKIAYSVPQQNGLENTGGLWVIETTNLPLGFSRDPRKITDGRLKGASWEWSPNGREILLTTTSGVFLLDAGTFTPQNSRINIVSTKKQLLLDWEQERKQKLTGQIRSLPDSLADLLLRKTSSVFFSPDKSKILYTASSSATLADNLIKPVPGASTQKQERNIQPGKTYVYDIKEDRNFLVENLLQNKRIAWLATSGHLLLAEGEKVSILDYDGTNKQAVYTGSYISPNAFSTLSNNRIFVLTDLGAANSLPNLYALSLK